MYKKLYSNVNSIVVDIKYTSQIHVPLDYLSLISYVTYVAQSFGKIFYWYHFKNCYA